MAQLPHRAFARPLNLDGIIRVTKNSASHAYRGGGDLETPLRKGVGLLGADFALENGQFDATIIEVGGGDPVHGFTTGPQYTMARRGLLDPKAFRIVWVVGPIPNAVMVTRTDRPQPFIDIVRGAMAALPYDNPDLWRGIGQPDGSAFAAVEPSAQIAFGRMASSCR